MKDGTKACYTARYNEIVAEQKGRNAVEVSAPDIYKHLQRLANGDSAAKVIKTTRTIYKLIFQYAINSIAAIFACVTRALPD
ncbi:MAG: hypothetical protein VB064_11075 [Oscillospiraceae bacterium]|nr:hypothetical protein [Oscillospiraceae bacterium]